MTPRASRAPESNLSDPSSLGDRVGNRALRAAFGGAVRMADWAGVDRTLRFGAAFGRLWWRLHGPRRRRVREQLAQSFPEMRESERQALELEVFEHLGQGIAELILMLGPHRRTLLDRMEVVGLEHLERAVEGAGGKGAVMIGPHMGNWELGAAKLASLGLPVAAVYRELRQPALESALVRLREAREGEGVEQDGGPASEEGTRADGERIQHIPMGPRAGVQFVRALEAGRHVLVLLDQHAHRKDGVDALFFGRPARTRVGPLKLADRTGAPVLVTVARRDEDRRRHVLTIRPALELEPGAARDDEVLRRNVQRVTTAIEKEIRIAPGQWIWTHRRWRVPRAGSGSD